MLSRGFSLTEMPVVVVIIGLAAAAAFFRTQSHLTRIADITPPPASMMRLTRKRQMRLCTRQKAGEFRHHPVHSD